MTIIEMSQKAKNYYDEITNANVVSGCTKIIGVDENGSCLIFRNSNVAMNTIPVDSTMKIFECVRRNNATKVELLR